MNDAVDLRAAATPAEACDWPITNCYVDAWMLVLRAWGLDPLAGLGVTVAQDYEGDQFTFFKYLHEDLENLYGVIVGELSIWHALEAQIATQVGLGRVVLVEVDGYYLPDTRATSYRTQHTKTTIAVDAMVPGAGRLTYFHNVGRYELAGEDYAGVFRRLPGQGAVDDVLPPYVEVARRRWPPLADRALTDAAVAVLRRHLRRRPEQNPIGCYRAGFAAQMDWLMAHPDRFHDYAFGVFRQLGANFQLLAAHMNWLTGRGINHLVSSSRAAAEISAGAKAMQFKAARIASRRRFDPCDALFDTLEQRYEAVIDGLARGLG
ncbi:MAG: DUF1839 family protein [Acetobacteraceae bacterium]|jgi:hypothetical protein